MHAALLSPPWHSQMTVAPAAATEDASEEERVAAVARRRPARCGVLCHRGCMQHGRQDPPIYFSPRDISPEPTLQESARDAPRRYACFTRAGVPKMRSTRHGLSARARRRPGPGRAVQPGALDNADLVGDVQGIVVRAQPHKRLLGAVRAAGGERGPMQREGRLRTAPMDPQGKRAGTRLEPSAGLAELPPPACRQCRNLTG
jgi:hypothetical protein